MFMCYSAEQQAKSMHSMALWYIVLFKQTWYLHSELNWTYTGIRVVYELLWVVKTIFFFVRAVNKRFRKCSMPNKNLKLNKMMEEVLIDIPNIARNSSFIINALHLSIKKTRKLLLIFFLYVIGWLHRFL